MMMTIMIPDSDLVYFKNVASAILINGSDQGLKLIRSGLNDTSCDVRKPVFCVSNHSDTNWSKQAQKAKSLQF